MARAVLAGLKAIEFICFMEVANPNLSTVCLLNRRSFVTGLCSVFIFVLLRGGFASSEQKSGLEERVRAITIRQLMTHTSGMAAERPPEVENITRTFDHTLAQTVALVAQQPLDFTPGSKWTYSSSGISVLGRVVEVVSGQPFERFMEQRVFEPLEMGQLFLHESRQD